MLRSGCVSLLLLCALLRCLGYKAAKEGRTFERSLLLFRKKRRRKTCQRFLQSGSDKTDALGDLDNASRSDGYVGQETHLHFALITTE